ncbi:MAG: right-handed parallel beta-helix repeat-containing protein [Cyclobacteriaceae bacterium]|nr:right-handed parallel beta-helix repeat-containing protein [Cyclobacteriaceae bacterium]MCX7638181.1 right-handed parallel beta-helix repeat-containing protein [Cyclobacteriaceae bacterium]MDW8332101.1 parallel beta-helix domain-containing protein [Cyclobacteriaceae bacterium]
MKIIIIVILSGLCLFSCRNQSPEPVVWKSIEKDLQQRLILAEDGETIELPEGHFMFTRTLSMDGKKRITIRGKGMDKTILSWKNQTEGAEGIHISNGFNIKLEDFTIEDAKGDNLKVNDTRGVIMRRIRSQWSGGPKTENGAYALYPVLCTRVLIEECIAMGSSDAGIYVGQSDTVIIRNNKAYWNVAGIEAENSKFVEIYGNEAYENTGGILVFDLPGLTTYGHSTKVYNNIIRNNNHENFAQKGNIVATIPPGSGLMILATHDAEIFFNEISHNKTVGLAIVSYELVAALSEGQEDAPGAVAGVQTVNNRFREDTLYNPYPYRILVHRNQFKNRHWFPSMDNDVGKLLAWKSLFNPPDILFDGITDPKREDAEICIGENGKITFINLDAANDFKNLSKDASPFECLKKNPYLDLKL